MRDSKNKLQICVVHIHEAGLFKTLQSKNKPLMDEDSSPETISRIFNIFFKTCTPPMKMTNFVTLP